MVLAANLMLFGMKNMLFHEIMPSAETTYRCMWICNSLVTTAVSAETMALVFLNPCANAKFCGHEQESQFWGEKVHFGEVQNVNSFNSTCLTTIQSKFRASGFRPELTLALPSHQQLSPLPHSWLFFPSCSSLLPSFSCPGLLPLRSRWVPVFVCL